MTRGKPSIEAEQYAVPGKPGADGKLALHSFRYEVFDLPALGGAHRTMSRCGRNHDGCR